MFEAEGDRPLPVAEAVARRIAQGRGIGAEVVKVPGRLLEEARIGGGLLGGEIVEGRAGRPPDQGDEATQGFLVGRLHQHLGGEGDADDVDHGAGVAVDLPERGAFAGQRAERGPEAADGPQIAIVVRVARRDDAGVVVVGVDDVPFGVGQKRADGGPGLGRERGVGRGRGGAATGGFDPGHGGEKCQEDQGKGGGGAPEPAEQPPHARRDIRPATRAMPPRPIWGRFAAMR